MLVLMIAWAGLMLACWLIGTAILNGVKGDCFERIGDRLIIAVWLGVVILSVSLLAVSLVLPLSPLVGALVAITMAAIALSLQCTRAEIRTLRSVLSAKWIFGFITLEAIVAASASQKITFFDTGLYHFQVIRWLSRFGAVPGLALIHNRFGFTSSWFALAAPFNAGIFEARTAALTSGFAFLLASLHFLICLTRI
ncbi:LIC_10190 family membrane protein, partial [Allocoleopsis sp.]|uniref:LIC_10190 family membrane protein n=1 Tax=Allocoleopsis sp. TaxID=3088169 RepID=UPI002FD6804A